MPGRHIGKRMNNSTHSVCIFTYMYVSGMKAYDGIEVKLLAFLTLPLDGGGRFHISAALHLRRRSPLPTEQENEWDPKPVWTLGRCEEETDVLSLLRNEPRLIACPAYSPVTLATELGSSLYIYIYIYIYIHAILNTTSRRVGSIFFCFAFEVTTFALLNCTFISDINTPIFQ